jgi:hypothetical protein
MVRAISCASVISGNRTTASACTRSECPFWFGPARHHGGLEVLPTRLRGPRRLGGKEQIANARPPSHLTAGIASNGPRVGRFRGSWQATVLVSPWEAGLCQVCAVGFTAPELLAVLGGAVLVRCGGGDLPGSPFAKPFTSCERRSSATGLGRAGFPVLSDEGRTS